MCIRSLLCACAIILKHVIVCVYLRITQALDELNAGECEGLTYEQIGEHHPKVTECRRLNKYYYRYPRGESYKDVVERLEPLLVELEREENVLIVSHQAVCRCLLAFFKTVPRCTHVTPTYMHTNVHRVCVCVCVTDQLMCLCARVFCVCIFWLCVLCVCLVFCMCVCVLCFVCAHVFLRAGATRPVTKGAAIS